MTPQPTEKDREKAKKIVCSGPQITIYGMESQKPLYEKFHAIEDEIAQALAAERQEAYRQGHIDHQLAVEAGAKVIADRLKGKTDDKAGEPMSHSFSAKEILARERQAVGEAILDVVWNDARDTVIAKCKELGIEIKE